MKHKIPLEGIPAEEKSSAKRAGGFEVRRDWRSAYKTVLQRSAEALNDETRSIIMEAVSAETAEEARQILDSGFLEGDISKELYGEIKSSLKEVDATEEGATAPTAESETKTESETKAEQVVAEITHDQTVINAAVETALPNVPPKQKEKITEELQSEDGRKKLIEKIKEFLAQHNPYSGWRGSWKEAAVGFATGAIVRNAIRLCYGSSLGVGIAAGAVAGAGAGLTREVLRQRKLLVAESVIQKVRESKNQGAEGRAALLAKAKKAYDDATIIGDREQIQLFGEELREMIILAKTEAEAMQGSSEKDKILNILKISDGARKDVKKDHQRKEAEKLINEVVFERTKFDRKKIAGAALRGAAVGALGGYLGGLMAGWISDHIHAGSDASQEAARLTGSRAPTAAMAEAIIKENGAKAEAAAEAAREALAKGHGNMLNAAFSETAEKGDGATHIARKVIHEYIANQRHLNPEAFQGISVEQLVHAEDTLQRQLVESTKGVIEVGQHFEVQGSAIENVLGKSTSLTPEKIANIAKVLQEPTHHLSKQTVEHMTSFNAPVSATNNFHDLAVKQAQEATAQAVQKAATQATMEIAQQATTTQAAAAVREIPQKAGVSMLTKIAAVSGLGIAAGASASVIHEVYLRNKKGKEKSEIKGSKAAAGETAVKETKEVAGAKAPPAEAPAPPKLERGERLAQEGRHAEAPPAEHKEAPTEEHKESRDAAQITFAKMAEQGLDVNKLNAATEEERKKLFAELSRMTWTKIAVHGVFGTDKTSKKKGLVDRSDLDGRSAVGLIQELAGVNVEEVKYVKPGSKPLEGYINLDFGGENGLVIKEGGKTTVIDHRAVDSERGTSTTEIVYRVLVKLGMIEKNEAADKLVEFVTHEDNKSFPEEEKYFGDSAHNLLGLFRFIKFDKLVEFFRAGKKPTDILTDEELKKFGLEEGSKEQKKSVETSSSKLEIMKKNGLIIDSDRYGKIVFDLGNKRMIPAGFTAAKAAGFDAYVIWDPKENSFFISSKKEITDSFPQGFRQRKTMWIKPRGDGVRLTVSLEDILRTMTDGKFKPDERFQKLVANSTKAAGIK
ncbi:MAG: hypothetical protein Q7R94_02085 [bacterium]|nr:hypothetical protein [bacterium]